MKNINWRLSGILGLGLILRCINLSTRSIQYDDAFSFFLARRDLTSIIQGTAADTMPPLYYFLLHFWMQVSQNIGWLRLLSIGLDLAAVLMLYLLVKRVFNHSSGLCAAFLGAISPLQIYHSQDIRMYALLAFTQMGYLLFFYLWWTKNKSNLKHWEGWLPVLIFGMAAMYTHNLAVFVLCVPDIFLILKREWRAVKNLIMVQLGIALMTIPWLLMIPGQVEKIQRAFWTPLPGLVEIFQAVIVMTANLPLEGIWLVVCAIVSLQILVLMMFEVARNKRLSHTYLLLSFFFPPVALFIVSYIMRPVFVPRGFITSAFIYLGIAGGIVGMTQTKAVKWLIAGGFVAAAVMALPYQMAFEQFPRSPFAQAMGAISQNLEPGELIIHENKLSFFPSYYYAPELDQVFIADEPGSPNDTYAPASQKAIGLIPENSLKDAVREKASIYFVVFQKTISEYLEMGELEHPSLTWLRHQFVNEKLAQFGDVNIYHFYTRK